MPRLKLIQIRGGTASAWTTANPVLAAREIALETDTRKLKFGDGTTAWNALAYGFTGGGGGGAWGTITGTLSDQTDLQTALNALDTLIDDHIADATAAHAASAISNTPAGGISATTVQAAINELDNEKQAAIGFTPENVANKKTDFTVIDNTGYPSVQAVENRLLAALAGLAWKAPVRVATAAAGTLATSFENGDTVDGVVLVTGDRVLLKNQATQSDNGIYTVNASGAPTRSIDADTAAELHGASVTVQEGTANANTTWVQTTDSITIGSSNIVWSQFGSSVPDASSSVKGIARLYPSTSLGTNVDGAPDQNAVKTYVDTAISGVTIPDSSETVKGKIEIATQAEMDTGTDDVRAVTPLKAFVKYEHKIDTINTQTGNYTLVLTDKDTKTIAMNVASVSNTVTVPPNSSVAFPIGVKMVIIQLGTGLTSMVQGAGVTVHPSKGDLLGQGQYSAMLLEKIASDEWVLLNGPGPIAGSAFTRTNDTNVTAVLSGSPSTALLAGVDIQLGWTGTLAVTRGGTGLGAWTSGRVVHATATNVLGESANFTFASNLLTVNGGLALAYAAKTTTYTLTSADRFIECTTGSFTITLPTAVGRTGIQFTIDNSGAGTITLATTSSQTIDGSAPGSLTAGQKITVYSNGANWRTY
jgi:hypothetical protein